MERSNLACLVRLATFLFIAFVYFQIVVPIVASTLYGQPIGFTLFPDMKIPNALDSWYSYVFSYVVIMEISYRNTTFKNHLWTMVVGFISLRLIVLVSYYGESVLFSPNRKLFQMVMAAMLPNSITSFALIVFGAAFPVLVGIFYTKIDGVRSNVSAQKLDIIKTAIKLAVLFFAPFVACAIVVLGTTVLFGIGGMIAYALLLPWMHLLKTLASVVFVGLVILGYKSSKNFAFWFAVLATSLPILHYFFSIRFREEYTSFASLFVFMVTVFFWRSLINRFIVRRLPQ
jgi:hypothetical protein